MKLERDWYDPEYVAQRKAEKEAKEAKDRQREEYWKRVFGFFVFKFAKQ